MDVKKCTAWIAVPGLTLVAIIGIGTQWGGVEDRWELMAQEAAEIRAEEVVIEQMVPMVSQLTSINESLRRAEDRELTDRCEKRAEKRGEEIDDYEPRCIKESNLRWLWWDYDDCMILTPENCTLPLGDRP